MFIKIRGGDENEIVINSEDVVLVDRAAAPPQNGAAPHTIMIGRSVIVFRNGMRVIVAATVEELYGLLRRPEKVDKPMRIAPVANAPAKETAG